MPDPIAFMVMPFGRRPTDRSEPAVPAEVDFDAVKLCRDSRIAADRMIAARSECRTGIG